MHATRDITRRMGPRGKTEGRIPVNGTDVTLRNCDPIGRDQRMADILEDRLLAMMQ